MPEVSSRIPKIKAKDAPIPSLEQLCENLSGADLLQDDASLPRGSIVRNQATVLSQEPEYTFEELHAEMDVLMRNTYPHYYHFLKTHMIAAEEGTEEFRQQEKEFKEAIVGCRQYPPEYFDDLEKSLLHYEKVSR